MHTHVCVHTHSEEGKKGLREGQREGKRNGRETEETKGGKGKGTEERENVIEVIL